MREPELSDRGFDSYRKELLRAKYVGREADQTTEVAPHKLHLYEEAINDTFEEAPNIQGPPTSCNILSEMKRDIQDDLNGLQQDTDAAIRRLRLQSLAKPVNESGSYDTESSRLIDD